MQKVEVEVLPPESKSHGTTEVDAAIGVIAHIMDSLFRVPGTKFRFGANPLIGFIPVVGDQIDAVVSASGISPDDLLIALYETPGENISFGRGVARRAHVSDQEAPAARAAEG